MGLEGAYAPEGLHPCTARAEKRCRLVVFSLEQVPESLLSSSQMGERVVFSLARQLHQSWDRLSGQKSGQLQPSFLGQVLAVEPGTVVIQEGEATDELYRIIATDQGLEVSSQGKVLSVLDQPGEFFGEMAAVLGEPRTASVRSLGRSTLEVYPSRLLFHILTDYPELSLRLIQGLSRRLQAANTGQQARYS